MRAFDLRRLRSAMTAREELKIRVVDAPHPSRHPLHPRVNKDSHAQR
jgi:hypothetical protein